MPRVLILYYTYTQQSGRVADVMAGAFRVRGLEVMRAAIEFTDALVVCRRYWRNNLKTVRKLGTKQGGQWLDGIHFAFAGGQIRSFLALVSYLGKGENRERYLGVRIPPTNLKPDYEGEARRFAGRLADLLEADNTTPRASPD